MKVIAFTALHYGKPYLASAIRSVIDTVDEHHIIYSAEGSHGFKTDAPCPDSRHDLLEIAHRAAGDKLRWHEGTFTHEGQQRDMIYEVAPDADIILVVDSDEIYPDGLAYHAVTLASIHPERFYRLPFIHFWRSFSRAILHDPAYPIRVVNTRNEGGEDTLLTMPVCHFGYAQPAALVEYKLRTHGHKNEIKPDWFETVFLDTSRTRDLHPVGSPYWNYENVNPRRYLPEHMESHPYYGLDWIE